MKKIKTLTAIALLILIGSVNTNAQETALLQVIHNAAGPGTASVDIYVNDLIFLDDFAFRTATPFLEVPADVNLTIGVAGPNSIGPEDIIAESDILLAANKKYVAIANGVLNPNNFAENPDGADISFTLFTRDRIKTECMLPNRVKLLAFHGATDAPGVDIMVANHWGFRWKLFNNLDYSEFSLYKTLLEGFYTLEVTPEKDNNTIVIAFQADLTNLGGSAAVVFASGFLDPSNNQGSEAFGLFVALPDGQVVELPILP
ncbi:MAG: DUF4397 domain-containing protein [Thermodesulfobacteriota bacterium]|nr:DUF4397 domain-containing protein [Thermodesulfobacteriota bacterium]